MALEIIRQPRVSAVMGLPVSTLYLHVKKRLMTSPLPLWGRAVGWPLHECEAINAARIAGKSEDEIRHLVARLEAERKAATSRVAA